jgi:cell division septation protein DedD
MAGNRPARERFDFSLDARQVAGVTLGSLGALGLAFLLGHSTGQRMAERPAAAPRPTTSVSAPAPADPFAGLDPSPRTDGGEGGSNFSDAHKRMVDPNPPPDRLPPVPRAQAPQPAPPAQVAVIAAAPSQAAPARVDPGPAVVAAPVAKPPVAAVVSPAAAPSGPSGSTVATASAPPATPVVTPPAKVTAAKGAFTVQVGSTQERFEADRIAARHASRGARVTVADVPGKGRWYRVRLGSFETRDAADRYLKELERSTGAKGFVAANN